MESKNLDSLLSELLKDAMIQVLLALPEPAFQFMMERLRRAHLEARGYKFMDPSMPGCESCEG